MNAQEINKAIKAECGCKCKGVGNAKACNWNCPCGNPAMSGACECQKNYFGDLNACHEFEKKLDYVQSVHFRSRLAGNSGKRNAEFLTVEAAMCHATAPQRCEAFLRTVNPERAKELYKC